MRLLSLTLLALTLHCAEETKLPADAQAAVDKADKVISIIQAKADADIDKIRQNLITALTRTQIAVTKKGDLDGANAVKAKIDALEKLTKDKEDSNDLLATNEKPTLAGTWQVIRFDQSVKCQIQVDKDLTSAVQMPNGIKGTVKDMVISWEDNSKWTITNNKGKWSAMAIDGILTLQR